MNYGTNIMGRRNESVSFNLDEEVGESSIGGMLVEANPIEREKGEKFEKKLKELKTFIKESVNKNRYDEKYYLWLGRLAWGAVILLFVIVFFMAFFTDIGKDKIGYISLLGISLKLILVRMSFEKGESKAKYYHIKLETWEKELNDELPQLETFEDKENYINLLTEEINKLHIMLFETSDKVLIAKISLNDV